MSEEEPCAHPNSIKDRHLGADTGDRVCLDCKAVFTPPRGRGRPPIGPLLTGVRIEESVSHELDRLTTATGMKRAELVRDLIDEALAARRRKAARGPR